MRQKSKRMKATITRIEREGCEIECSKAFLLPQSPRSEHFSYKVDVLICSIDPRSIEFHNVLMFQCFQEMNLRV